MIGRFRFKKTTSSPSDSGKPQYADCRPCCRDDWKD